MARSAVTISKRGSFVGPSFGFPVVAAVPLILTYKKG